MGEALDHSALDRWKQDAAAFINEVMIDPDTGAPFVLLPAERAFLRRAFKRTADGRLRYPELVYSAPKKSGKSAFAGMLVLTATLVHGGPNAEAYCCANDYEQASGRVFEAIRRIVTASPFLRAEARITAGRIEFPETGSTICAIASDYAGAAGANPTISSFDELWGYTSERSRRLWDEMVPPPTRKIAARLTTTYAGFEGESTLLESLYRRGLEGRKVGRDLYSADRQLTFWTHKPVAPWQDKAWLAQMREQLRPNQYLRMIENRFTSTDSTFVDPAWLDACTDPNANPIPADTTMPVWVGVDASTKHDSTAIVCVTWDADAKKVRLIWHRIFVPSKTDHIDFESTIEATILDLRDRFQLRAVRYDPWQMQASAQRLRRAGVPMVEFPQSIPNLTAASQALYEAVKGQTITLYADADIRRAFGHAIAVESTRGWRIAKERASHRIDVVVALAQATHAAIVGGQRSPTPFIIPNGPVGLMPSISIGGSARPVSLGEAKW